MSVESALQVHVLVNLRFDIKFVFLCSLVSFKVVKLNHVQILHAQDGQDLHA